VNGGDYDAGYQAGIEQAQQECQNDPASCGIDSASCKHSTYEPSKGEVHIPFIDVPGAFGTTQTFDIYLMQQPSTLTFDLDLQRIILKQTDN